MMRQFRVYFFHTLAEKRCQYEVLEMVRAGDTMGAEAAAKRAEIVDTHKKGLKRKGCWGNNVINLCGLPSLSTTLYCCSFSYFFCFSFLLPKAVCVDKSFDNIYCSTWSGFIEDDMFILGDIWKNAVQKGSVTFCNL